MDLDHLARPGNVDKRDHANIESRARGSRDDDAARLPVLHVDDPRRVEDPRRRCDTRTTAADRKRMGLCGIFLRRIRRVNLTRRDGRPFRRNISIRAAADADDSFMVSQAAKSKGQLKGGLK